MGKQQNIKRTRKKAVFLYRKYRATLILTNSLSPDERKKIDMSLERVQKMDSDKITTFLPQFEKEAKDLFKKYGVIGSAEDLEKILEINPQDDKPITFVAKFAIDQLFNHYERRLPDYSKLPPHARIGIERYGTNNKEKFEILMLEASLFEDMAALWNSSLEANEFLLSNYSKEGKKRLRALLRATAKATFNLIEGYLNALALDILSTQTVSDKEQALLMEWDSEKTRPRFLTLRDKLLQYPRIALRIQYPPLDESSFSPIKTIIDLESKLRHSLIHPTPQVSMKDTALSREQIYLNLSIDDVASLCDLTIDVIRQVDQAISQKFGGVDSWLINPGSAGFFPDDVFT